MNQPTRDFCTRQSKLFIRTEECFEWHYQQADGDHMRAMDETVSLLRESGFCKETGIGRPWPTGEIMTTHHPFLVEDTKMAAFCGIAALITVSRMCRFHAF